jgi:hypothetical protein
MLLNPKCILNGPEKNHGHRPATNRGNIARPIVLEETGVERLSVDVLLLRTTNTPSLHGPLMQKRQRRFSSLTGEYSRSTLENKQNTGISDFLVRNAQWRDDTSGRAPFMPEFPETNLSLIARVKDLGDGASWGEFLGIYQPVVYRMA